MQIYHYSSVTHEFFTTSQADESPLEQGVFLIPSDATSVQPPSTGINQAAIFNGSAWLIVNDFRGTVYYMPDGSRHEITVLDSVPPLESSPNPPPPSLEQQQTTLLNAINSERGWRWRAGFPVQVGGVTKWFHSDEFSLTQHLGLKDKARDVLAAGGALSDSITIAGQPVYWSTMDGSQVAITAQVAFDLVAGAALQQALVFLSSQAHEVAINAAEDLSDYDVLANWPAVFVE